MHFPTLSAILLSAFCLTVTVQAERVIQNVACAEYNPYGKDTVVWYEEGLLTIDKSSNGNLRRTDHMRLKEDRAEHKGTRATNYMYTISAGVDPAIGSELFVKVVRSKGKGLGQQFRVDFLDVVGNTLKAYWIMPNQRCSTKTPFAAVDVKSVRVWSVKY